jgi:hypothetical protein
MELLIHSTYSLTVLHTVKGVLTFDIPNFPAYITSSVNPHYRALLPSHMEITGYFVLTFSNYQRTVPSTLHLLSVHYHLSHLPPPLLPTCYVITYPFCFFLSQCPNTQLYTSSEIWQRFVTSQRGGNILHQESLPRYRLLCKSAILDRPPAFVLRLTRRGAGPSSLHAATYICLCER